MSANRISLVEQQEEIQCRLAQFHSVIAIWQWCIRAKEIHRYFSEGC